MNIEEGKQTARNMLQRFVGADMELPSVQEVFREAFTTTLRILSTHGLAVMDERLGRVIGISFDYEGNFVLNYGIQ